MNYRKYKSRHKLENKPKPKKILLKQVVMPDVFNDDDLTLFNELSSKSQLFEVSLNYTNLYYTLYYRSEKGSINYENMWVYKIGDVMKDLYMANKIIVPKKINIDFIKYSSGEFLKLEE